jgi:hypothetical protein
VPDDVAECFDLHVLAIDPSADLDAVKAMVERCQRGPHPEGVALSGSTRNCDRSTQTIRRIRSPQPWMSMPLDVGIDHVMMSVSYSERGDGAINAVMRLVGRFGLVVYDPQFDEVFRPAGRESSAGERHGNEG